MKLALAAIAIAAWLWPGMSGADDIAVPYLSGRVVDEAEILSTATKQRVDAMLAAHERATGDQIAVLTVSGTGDESIEDFAVRVFEGWKLGTRDKDNGVLIVVAPREHRMRIEVGYGLEDTLTDVAADRIIRNLMTPRFRENNYDVGIESGATAVIQVLEGRVPTNGDADWASPPPHDRALYVSGTAMTMTTRIVACLFVFSIIGLFTAIGILTPGGVSWFLYLFLVPFWSMFPMAFFGGRVALAIVGTYAILYPVLKFAVARMPWYIKAREDLKTKGVAHIGGLTLRPGTSDSGNFASGGGYSSGGGGFSGGGGRSGGGGASGSW